MKGNCPCNGKLGSSPFLFRVSTEPAMLEEARGICSGFAITTLTAHQVEVGRTLSIILRETSETWKLNEIMRSAAIFPKQL